MARKSPLRKSSSTEHRAKLRLACRCFDVNRGRAAQYINLIKEFEEKGKRSKTHILAINESCEIVDLFELWEHRALEFPGLKKRIGSVVNKGPLLREDEVTAASSNRARNDAFGFLAAGKLLAASVPVVAVDGIIAKTATCESKADFTFQWKNGLIDVECKRPQTVGALRKRAKKARNQIADRGDRHGIIALDCSVLCRPDGTVFGNSPTENAEMKMSVWLEKDVYPRVHPLLTEQILGFLLFARFPAMTPLNLVGQNQGPINRPDSISSWLVVGNSNHPDSEILQCVAKKLKEALPTA